MGTSNTSADDTLKANDFKNSICGIKIFMGASTGNMLVDNYNTLDKVFRESEMLIATHCESESIIKENYERLKALKGELSPADHPLVRDENGCYESSLMAIQTPDNTTPVYIFCTSTGKETEFVSQRYSVEAKTHYGRSYVFTICGLPMPITQHLVHRIKWNPAVKAQDDKEELWKALLDDRIDVIATDHAPHTWEEKQGSYENAHAGLPLVQHPLLLMLHYYKEGRITLERIVEKMSHAVADCFQINERGYIREGYFADIMLVDLNNSSTVSKENLLYKCGWSPLEGFTFPATITHTFVNGNLVYENGTINESNKGQRLLFNR